MEFYDDTSVRYSLIKSNTKEGISYGISVKRAEDGREIERVEDISQSCEFVKNLVELFNSEQLSYTHLYCALEDALFCI